MVRLASAAMLAAAVWAAIPARAQTDQMQSLRAALSLIGGGALDSLGPELQLTRDGDTFRIHIDLPGLAPPRNAAISAAATQLPPGIWDISAFTLPPRGTLFRRREINPGAQPIAVAYSIAKQTGQARIDPTLASPSTYRIALDGIALHASAARPGERLSIGKIALDGVITGEGGGLITERSHLVGDNIEFSGHSTSGFLTSIAIRSIDARYQAHGVGRAQRTTLRQALAAAATQPGPPPAPDQPPGISPLQRRQLLAMIDAGTGLLSGFSLQETFRGLHVSVPQGSADLGQVRFAIESDSKDGRVAAHIEFGLDDLVLPAASPQFRPLVPRHIALRAAASGLQPAAVRSFLRTAVAGDADYASLSAQAIALLDTPGARAGIEAMSADVGPMRLQGSARVLPRPDGAADLNIHLTATGLDALLQLVEADPHTHRTLPALLLAKALGRSEGDRIVWDIDLGHGGVTVNGIAMGPHTRGARAIAEAPASGSR